MRQFQLTRYVRLLIAATASSLLLATQSFADPRLADLQKRGKIRLGLFLPQYEKILHSGEIRGVGAHIVSLDVAREFATRVGVPVEYVTYRTPPEVVGCLKGGYCDLGIMGVDPTRSADVGLTPAFIQFDFTFLVPEKSQASTFADVQGSGARVGVVKGHAATILLKRIASGLEYSEAQTPEDALSLLQARRVDMVASSRPTLIDFEASTPGLRVLKDRYGLNLVALAVPKDQVDSLAYLGEFIAELKRTGWLERAIRNAALHGFEVASP